MDFTLIVVAVVVLVAWAAYGTLSRHQKRRARETIRVAPVFRLTVTPDRAKQLAEQRTRIAIDAESAALSRGEQDSGLYSHRVKALMRLEIEVPEAGGDPFNRD